VFSNVADQLSQIYPQITQITKIIYFDQRASTIILALRTNSAAQASGGWSRSWFREARNTFVIKPSLLSASSSL